jgi:hypothetical protein
VRSQATVFGVADVDGVVGDGHPRARSWWERLFKIKRCVCGISWPCVDSRLKNVRRTVAQARWDNANLFPTKAYPR